MYNDNIKNNMDTYTLKKQFLDFLRGRRGAIKIIGSFIKAFEINNLIKTLLHFTFKTLPLTPYTLNVPVGKS